MGKKKVLRTAQEPQPVPGFDSGALLGQLYTYLLSTRDLAAKLRASGLADSNHTPMGALRMHLNYLSPMVNARCEELATTLAKQPKGTKHVDATVVEAIQRSGGAVDQSGT